MSQVIIRPVTGRGVEETLKEVLDFCQWGGKIRPGTRVVVKPNLSSADPERLCCNTSREVLLALCRLLLSRGAHVVVGESDGMRNGVEEAFEAMGLYQPAKEMGFRLLNFSKDELVPVSSQVLGSWLLAKTWLEAEVFITVPVLKTHPRSVITGALKNQWGCIPQHDRLLLHRYLAELIAELHQVAPPMICVMDALQAMEGLGPSNGTLVPLGLLMGSTDPVALDATAQRLVGLEHLRSKVTEMSAQKGIGVMDPHKIIIDGDLERFKTKFKPGKMDWALRIMDLVSRSRYLTYRTLLDDRFFYPARVVVRLIRRSQALLHLR